MMILFQAIDWQWFHKTYDDISIYTIQIYGKQQNGKSICVNVNKFTPYFYMKISDTWTNTNVNIMINNIKKKIKNNKLKDTLINHKIIKRHDVNGFTNYEKKTFVQLIFNNYSGFKEYAKICEQNEYELYESDIDPILRCIHLCKLDACGWIQIDEHKENNGDYMTNCELNIETDWINLSKYDMNTISNDIVIAAFDIECYNESGKFPLPEDNNPIILIATTFNKYGNKKCFYNHVVALHHTDNIEDTDVEWYNTEEEMIEAWSKMIKKMSPDVMTGYNIFGFDYDYIYKRSKMLGIEKNVSKNLSKLLTENAKFKEHSLSSSALGNNNLKYYNPKGIVQIDLMKTIQKDYKLDSYSLDAVSSYFIKEKIIEIKNNDENKTEIFTNSVFGLKKDLYITIKYNDGLSDIFYKNKKKFKIDYVNEKSFVLTENIGEEITEIIDKKLFWSQAKDNLPIQQMFKFFRGTSSERAINAKYCLQDCSLCNILMDKLQILTNNIGMANVTCVPLYYLFIRGQTIKGYSLFSKKCNELGFLISLKKKIKNISDDEYLVNKKKIVIANEKNGEKNGENDENDSNDSDADDSDNDNGFKGAYVLSPLVGLHTEPVIVLDYASLYPSCIIEYNMSLETVVKDKKYVGLLGFDYLKINYEDTLGNEHESIFVKDKSGKLGIIPQILLELLNARSNTKKEMKNEKDPFVYSVLDGRQLAFKISANSIYGLTGARVSPLYCKKIAGSTTAAGRNKLLFAKDFIENKFSVIANHVSNNYVDKFILFVTNIFKNVDPSKFPNGMNFFINNLFAQIKNLLDIYVVDPKIIYGDTDSVFFILYLNNKNNNINDDTIKRREISINFGKLISSLMKYILPYPHDIQYEKTLHPFCILTKKRYVGNLYENDPHKFSQKCMGIVLKRRDNAPIVKIVCGGIINNMLNNPDKMSAITYTHTVLQDILSHKYSIDKFIISKTLRENYKDRSRIAHAILADRMKLRDPGNCPQSNDRIQYAYIISSSNVKLQGDRIEHIDYIIQNKLKIDYLFYITNQIIKPSIQFLELICNNPDETIFKPYILSESNKNLKMKSINHYFNNPSDDVKSYEEFMSKKTTMKNPQLDNTNNFSKSKKTSKHIVIQKNSIHSYFNIKNNE